MIKRIHDYEFESKISNIKELTLVNFFGIWDPNCSSFSPVINDVSTYYQSIFEVNVDQNSQILSKYDINYIPTLVLYKNGIEVDRIEGKTDKQNILKMIKENM